jgi:toxin-antitoxin system PIN domain toxin
VILVDVGVWLAAIWGRHVHHHVARQWFEDETDDLILCRVTQMSLLRLITNPAILGEDAVTRSEAWRVVDRIWADNRVLWAEEPDQLEAVFRAISARDDNSHKLWTDDYLAAFAQASGASLVTLDTKLKARYPSVQVDQLRPQ